jgi:hypothetical protein
MAYQGLGLGTAANDGSGDTLRDAGAKLNANFGEVYNKFGDGSGLCSGVSSTASVILAAGSLTDSSGAISFGNENLTTTGTFTSGNISVGNIVSSGASIVFEGASDDAHETTLTVTDPTADRTITFANESGTVLTTGTTNIVSGAMLKSASTLLIVNSGGTTLKTIIGSGVAS